MTRDDVKRIFPDVTEDQLSKLLNMHNGEVTRYKAGAEGSKALEEEKKSLLSKIEELEQGKMTEAEKLAKEAEKSAKKIAELERVIAVRDRRETLAGKLKLTAEQAAELLGDDGNIDYDVLGKITAEKEQAAALAKEQEIAKHASNPNGGGQTDGNDKSSAVRLVEKHFSGAKNANAAEIVAKYANGGR